MSAASPFRGIPGLLHGKLLALPAGRFRRWRKACRAIDLAKPGQGAYGARFDNDLEA